MGTIIEKVEQASSQILSRLIENDGTY